MNHRFSHHGVLLAFAVLLSCLSLVSVGQDGNGKAITGKVIGVHDGDTLTLLVDRSQLKIRLEAIDAPELGQAFSAQSRFALLKSISQKQATIQVTGQDRYGRTLGFVLVDGKNINEAMLRDGWAWHFKKYNQDPRLAAIETEAKEAKRGLWAEPNPLAPWEYRERKSAASTLTRGESVADGRGSTGGGGLSKGESETTGGYWLNTSSNVRHNASCQYFKNTKKGRVCGPNDGKRCGMCGG